MHYNNVAEMIDNDAKKIELEAKASKSRTFKKVALIKIRMLQILKEMVNSPARDELVDYTQLWAEACKDYLYKIRNI